MVNGYRIGEVAAKAGVTVDTLRYYERLGVLPRARRTTGGLRQYGDDVLRHVRFIQQAQALGLTLKDVNNSSAIKVEVVTTGVGRFVICCSFV